MNVCSGVKKCESVKEEKREKYKSLIQKKEKNRKIYELTREFMNLKYRKEKVYETKEKKFIVASS